MAMTKASSAASSRCSPSGPASLESTWTAASRGGLCPRYCLVSASVSQYVCRNQFLILSLAAWFGSLMNGPVADRFGRKRSITMAVVIFVIGSAIQCAAMDIPMLFTGECRAYSGIGPWLTPCLRQSNRWVGHRPADYGCSALYL